MTTLIEKSSGYIIETSTHTLKDYIDRSQMGTEKSLLLVNFWKPNSIPCARMSVFLKYAADLCDEFMKVLRVDVDEYPRISYQHHVYRIPTFIMYQWGEVVANITTTDPIRLEKLIVDHIQQTYP